MFYMLMASLFKVEPSPMPAAPFELYQSPQKPASPLPSSSRKRKHASSHPLDPTAEWLRQKASQQPHYRFFVESHHRTLQNAEIVIIWRFAAEFHDIYYQAKCDTTKARITKLAIQSCLGIGETWLTDALVGHRLVKIYGPGGSHSAAEVVSELEVVRTAPYGRFALLSFLKDWEEAHPCI